MQHTLKKIDMRVVPKDECRTILDDNDKKALGRYALHYSFLCVGGEKDKDTCEGDGGSPHVCFNKDKKYVLVGAVSHGKGCGTEIPASYSNVAGSMCWIDYVMSTVPKANFDVDIINPEDDDDDDDFDLDLRSGTKESVNKLTQEQCREWRTIQILNMK